MGCRENTAKRELSTQQPCTATTNPINESNGRSATCCVGSSQSAICRGCQLSADEYPSISICQCGEDMEQCNESNEFGIGAAGSIQRYLQWKGKHEVLSRFPHTGWHSWYWWQVWHEHTVRAPPAEYVSTVHLDLYLFVCLCRMINDR